MNTDKKILKLIDDIKGKQKMNYTKLQKKIIEYISKIYQKEQNLKIEITKIDFIKFKNESNKFLIYFEYDFIDDNNNEKFSWSSLYLDLEKISFFDIFIKKPNLNKRNY